MKRNKGLNTFSSLRNINYRRLWFSTLFGVSGAWIQQITLSWLVWELSGSATIVGITAGLRSIPFLFMSPISGVAVDRLDRRRILMVVQIVMAAVAVLFALVVAMKWVQVWHAMLFSFLMGCGHTMFLPVSQALVANTVPRKEMANAIALSAMAFNTSRIIGPALGGILIVTLGAAGNFLLQAALYVCLVVIAIPMKTPFRDAAPLMKASIFQSMYEGIKYIWRDKTLLGLIILSYIPALFIIPITHLMPAFTDIVLHSGANTYGYLMAVYGVGGLLATLTLASTAGSIRSGWLGIVSLAWATSSILLLSQFKLLWVAYLLIPSIGFSMIMFRVNNNTFVQMLSSDHMRGRVTSIYTADHAFTPIASSTLGVIADVFSVPVAIAFSGLTGLICLILLLTFVKAIRDLRNVHI